MVFSLSILSFICSTAWLLYGVLIADLYVQVPNLLGSLLCLAQLLLFLRYVIWHLACILWRVGIEPVMAGHEEANALLHCSHPSIAEPCVYGLGRYPSTGSRTAVLSQA